MLTIFGVLLVLIFGYLLSSLFVREMRVLERLGTSFLLGFGIFTLLMFCYSTLGIKITTESTMIALVLGIIFLFILLRILKRKIIVNPLGSSKTFLTFSKFEKIIVFVIAGLMVSSLVIAIYFPVTGWDALVLYDFRAKIIAEVGFYTQIAKNITYFAGYPLFTSLSHTLVYLFGGRNPQFLYSLLYISFIFIFYDNLRKSVNRMASLTASLLLATSSAIFSHSTIAYTNLPYTIFLVTGAIYLYVWFAEKRQIGYLILAGVLTGLSTWTRSVEPFWIVNILILGFITIFKFKKFFLSTFVYLLPFLLIREPWYFINYNHVTNVGVTKATPIVAEASSYVSMLLGTKFDYGRIGEIAIFVYKNIISSWFPLFYLFLIFVIINCKNLFRKTSSFFLAIFLLHFSFLIYSTYMFSFTFPEWRDIPDSAMRMAMFFIPLIVYYIGLGLGDTSFRLNWKKYLLRGKIIDHE